MVGRSSCRRLRARRRGGGSDETGGLFGARKKVDLEREILKRSSKVGVGKWGKCPLPSATFPAGMAAFISTQTGHLQLASDMRRT